MAFLNIDKTSLFLGSNCNLNCIYCHEKNRNETYNLENLFYKANEILKIQSEFITLTGGEPSIHEDFNFVLNYCLMKFKNICLLTNGLELKKDFIDLNYLERLKVIIPFDSHNEKLHNFLCGKKCFKEKLKKIDFLYKNKLRLTIGILVNSFNILDIKDTVEFIIKRWPNVEIFFKVLNMSGFGDRQTKKLMVKYSIIDYVLKPIFSHLDSIGKNSIIVNQPYCWLIGNEIKSLEYQTTKGIFTGTSIEEDIKSFRGEYENNFIDGCKNCVHASYCIGISRNYLKIFGQDEFVGVIGQKFF